MSSTINWTYRLVLRRLSPWPYFRSKRSISCLGRIFANVWKTVLYCAMVRNTLQKAVFADFLLARNRFRTNYKAIFLWDSSDLETAQPRVIYEISMYRITHYMIWNWAAFKKKRRAYEGGKTGALALVFWTNSEAPRRMCEAYRRGAFGVFAGQSPANRRRNHDKI